MKLYQHFISLIIFLFVSIFLVAQKVETNVNWLTNISDTSNDILYSPGHKLSIEDFKGIPDNTPNAVAITASGFLFTTSFHSKGDKATLSIGIYCSFDTKGSWMKEKGKTAYILEHEQHHFDISYLNTLFFIKKLKHTKFKQDDYMEQLRSLYKEVVDRMETMQNKYDTETANGMNKEKQAEWNKKIGEMLTADASEQVL
jgi:hypothetical protein